MSKANLGQALKSTYQSLVGVINEKLLIPVHLYLYMRRQLRSFAFAINRSRLAEDFESSDIQDTDEQSVEQEAGQVIVRLPSGRTSTLATSEQVDPVPC